MGKQGPAQLDPLGAPIKGYKSAGLLRMDTVCDRESLDLGEKMGKVLTSRGGLGREECMMECVASALVSCRERRAVQ